MGKLQGGRDAPQLEACVSVGNSFWASLDKSSESAFEDEDKKLLKAIYDPCLSDRRDEGDRFVPPDPNMKYIENLRNLVKEEEAIQQSRRNQFFSEKFAANNPGPIFPSSWTSCIKVTNEQTVNPVKALHARPEYKAELGMLRSALESTEPIFNMS